MSFDVVAYTKRKAVLKRLMEGYEIPRRYRGALRVILEAHSAGRFGLAASICGCLSVAEGEGADASRALRSAALALAMLGWRAVHEISWSNEHQDIDEMESIENVTFALERMEKSL